MNTSSSHKSDNSDVSTNENTIDEFDEKHDKFENFGGLNEDGPRKPRKLNRCQTSILNPLTGINQPVSILKNGHTSTVGRPVVVTIRTCAFDSILNLFAVAYADTPSFKETVDESETSNSLSQLIKMMFTEKEHKIYNERNRLLSKFLFFT